MGRQGYSAEFRRKVLDLVRAKTVTAVGASLAGASLRPYVRQTLTDMLTEITGLNHRVRDLDITSKELVSPLAPTLLQITGISYNSAAVLIAEVGDITRFPSSAKGSAQGLVDT